MPQAARRKSWDAGCCLPTAELLFCCEFRRKKPLLRRKGTARCKTPLRFAQGSFWRVRGKKTMQSVRLPAPNLCKAAFLISWWSPVLSVSSLSDKLAFSPCAIGLFAGPVSLWISALLQAKNKTHCFILVILRAVNNLFGRSSAFTQSAESL